MSSTTKNILNADVEIRGDLTSSGDIAFNGKIEGNLATEKGLELGEEAVVKGNILANNAIVRGKINGNITIKDKLEVKTRTELTGDVKASKLVIEEGVVFLGKAEINPTKAVAASAAPHQLRPGEAYKASEPARMGR